MDAYLAGHIKSLVQTAETGKLQSSRRIFFRKLPGLEYQFSHRIESTSYITRGVAFMIDGGHIRISMSHSANEVAADANYKRFVESFQLGPIAYRAASKPFIDKRGIEFSPPEGWLQKTTQNPAHAASFGNLTRSLFLLVAGNGSYTCNNFQTEIQASGRLQTTETVSLAGQRFVKLKTFEEVPQYQIRLTTVQYCINSRYGAVVLKASEEEFMFSRWEKVFEGTAATIRLR